MLPAPDLEERVKQLYEAALAADLEAHRMLLAARRLYCGGKPTHADLLEVSEGLDEARELLSKGRATLRRAGKGTGAWGHRMK